MKRRKNRSTYIIIISSYVIMMIVFTVLMAGLIFYSADSITKQQLQSDEYIAEHVMLQVDNELEGLFEHGEMLIQDERLTTFFGAGSEELRQSFQDIGGIMDRANAFTRRTTDLFFCPAGAQIVLNRTGLHMGQNLEELLQNTMGISVDEWVKRSSFDGSRSIQIVMAPDPDGVWHRQFLMIVRGPEGSGIARAGLFIAGIVPLSMLQDISSDMRSEGFEDIIIEYPDGFFSFRKEDMVTREEVEAAERGRTDVFSLLFSRNPIHVTTCASGMDGFDCKIHFFCSMEPYRNIVRVCFRIFIISVLIVVAFGTILLYFTLTRQYRPLRALLDRVSGLETDSAPVLRGEYREIDQAIGKLQEQHQGMETRLEEYRTQLQNTRIRQLLRGIGVQDEKLSDYFGKQELEVHSEQCRVLLLALGDVESIEDEDESVAGARLDQLLEELSDRIYPVFPESFCVITDYTLECLILGGQDKSDAENLRLLRDSLTDFCRENGLHFYAAISKTDTGTEGACRAFAQAETILDHATMTGYRDVILNEVPEQRNARTAAGRQMRQLEIIQYVNEHVTDPSLSVLQIADEFDMSPSSVSRTFRQAAGTGLNTYIHTLRIAQAKELIESTQDSLKQISEKVGYGNQITMIRAFKKLEGITPKEYREQFEAQKSI